MDPADGLAALMKLANTIKRGDIIGVKGLPGKTKRGELSIFPTHLEILIDNKAALTTASSTTLFTHTQTLVD